MIKWLHQLFNPHCEHCIEELKESKLCSSCETLRFMLDQANHEKRLLLDKLLIINQPIEQNEVNHEIKEPIKTTRFVSWRVRQQMLENEDRERARLLQNKEKEIKQTNQSTSVETIEQNLSIEELEKQIGLSTDKVSEVN